MMAAKKAPSCTHCHALKGERHTVDDLGKACPDRGTVQGDA
jgi:hypothetical protein